MLPREMRSRPSPRAASFGSSPSPAAPERTGFGMPRETPGAESESVKLRYWYQSPQELPAIAVVLVRLQIAGEAGLHPSWSSTNASNLSSSVLPSFTSKRHAPDGSPPA